MLKSADTTGYEDSWVEQKTNVLLQSSFLVSGCCYPSCGNKTHASGSSMQLMPYQLHARLR
jgi:hypothetical protein